MMKKQKPLTYCIHCNTLLEKIWLYTTYQVTKETHCPKCKTIYKGEKGAANIPSLVLEIICIVGVCAFIAIIAMALSGCTPWY